MSGAASPSKYATGSRPAERSVLKTRVNVSATPHGKRSPASTSANAFSNLEKTAWSRTLMSRAMSIGCALVAGRLCPRRLAMIAHACVRETVCVDSLANTDRPGMPMICCTRAVLATVSTASAEGGSKGSEGKCMRHQIAWMVRAGREGLRETRLAAGSRGRGFTERRLAEGCRYPSTRYSVALRVRPRRPGSRVPGPRTGLPRSGHRGFGFALRARAVCGLVCCEARDLMRDGR